MLELLFSKTMAKFLSEQLNWEDSFDSSRCEMLEGNDQCCVKENGIILEDHLITA